MRIAEKIKRLFVVDVEERSVNNPATASLSKPSTWLTSLFSPAAKSGVQVSPETVISLTAVWRAVSIVSGSIAALPFDIVEESEDGSIKVAKKHPLYFLLKSEPNELYSTYIFLQTLVANALLTGNGYAIITRDPVTARPTKFTLVNSLETKVSAFISDEGSLFYKIDGHDKTYAAYDLIHIQNVGFNGVSGLDSILTHKDNYGFGLASRDFGNVFFKNGAHLGGYIKYPGVLNDEQYKRLGKSWNMAYSGIDKAGKTAILEESAEFIQLGTDPEKAQMLASQKFNVEDVSRITGVPMHLLSSLDRATFNNIEHLSQEFSTYTLRLWAEQIEQEFNRKILRKDERGTYSTRLAMDAIMRGDLKSRSEYIDKGVKGGWLSINDARKIEGLNPIEGGDVHLVPLNQGTLSSDGTIKSHTSISDGNRTRKRKNKKSFTRRHAKKDAPPIEAEEISDG